MPDTRPKIRPSAEDWEQAVSNIFDYYPPDIFPPDSDSPDAKAGTWARKICLNIITEAWRVNTARIDGSVPDTAMSSPP
jgi:hypothetical protein